MPAQSAVAPTEHPHLTTMGLFFEAHAGVIARVGKPLEADHGLSGQPFEVLVRLARTPGHRLRMSDLALQTTLSASGLTRVVDRLVASGLVRRATCPSDRRGTFAELTPKGEDKILSALPDHVEELGDVLDAAFTPQEQHTFAELMRKLRDVVHPGANSGGPDGRCPEV